MGFQYHAIVLLYVGLQLNSTKFELITANVHPDTMQQIQQATGFQLGSLLVR